ncbi:MAG: stage II sporulation protein M [Parvularculaceae bacterium]
MSTGNTEEILLQSRRFRMEREADWRRLEELLEKVASKSVKSLSDEEMIALPRVYRSTLSALSVARATSLDQNVVDYLESLSTRAYFFIYGARATMGERIAHFFRSDWPLAMRAIWRETLIAFVITIAAAATAYALVMSDPDWFYSFIPENFAQGRDPGASTEALRSTLYHEGGKSGLSVFATFLFTHNAQVALLAFALGFAFCLPSVFLLAQNGCILGAFVALFVSRGLGFELGGWLLIHGVTELFAIFIAGAAGMRIGWAIANPGKLTRLAAAAEAARSASVALAGVVIMLFVAGLIEGFGRQLITSDVVRYLFALATALFWGAYFYAYRPGERI